MYKQPIFISLDHRQALLELMTECGYIPGAQFAKPMSMFINDFFHNPTKTVSNLDHSRPPHITPNRILLELPVELATVPEHFGLLSWDQLLTNIARRIIVADPYPTLPIYTQSPKRQLTQHPTNMRQYRPEITTSLPQTLPPVYPPDYYIDNRPLPPSFLTGPTNNTNLHWHISDIPRQQQIVYVTPEYVDALKALTKTYSIVPFGNRTETTFFRIALEALVHNLLIPNPNNPLTSLYTPVENI